MYLTRNMAEYICFMQVAHKKKDGMVPHYHESALGGYDYELVYVVSGRATHVVDGVSYEIGQGNYFFVDYGSEHTYEIAEGEELVLINLIFDYRALDLWYKRVESLAALAAFHDVNPNIDDVGKRTDMLFSDEDGRIRAAFEEIGVELNGRKPGYHEIVKCKLMEILLRGFRIYFKKDSSPKCSPPVKFILEYLNNYYMTSTTLSELAEQLRLSVPYLSKRFKDEVGKNYIDYLHSRRISEGCRILSTSADSIECVAEYVGYSDSKKFREKFKERYGSNPLDYRKQNKG